MTASHRAEPYHVRALESMLEKIGIGEDELACPSTYPLNASARHELVAQGNPERRLYHNCSGKHLGLLSYCKSKGYGTADYADPNHPAQQEVLAALAMLAGITLEQLAEMLQVLVAALDRDIADFGVRIARDQRFGMLHPKLGQVFQKVAPGILTKQRAEIASAITPSAACSAKASQSRTAAGRCTSRRKRTTSRSTGMEPA